jgi:hypothetical protein
VFRLASYQSQGNGKQAKHKQGINQMKAFKITAMNVQNGHTKTIKVMADNYDHAVQVIESDEYITSEAPYGFEVTEYEFN